MPIRTPSPGALRYLLAEDLELLLSLGYRRSYSAGEMLIASGERIEYLFVIEEGQVSSPLEDEWPENWSTGDVLGVEALAGRPASARSASARTDVVAMVFDLAALERFALDYPEAAARLCLGIAAEAGRQLGHGVAGRGGLLPDDSGERPAAGTGAAPAEAAGVADFAASRSSRAARSALRALQSLPAAPAGGREKWLTASLRSAGPLLDKISQSLAVESSSCGDGGTGLVRHIRGELRPLLTRSRLTERMNDRGPDEPARYRSLEHIFRNQPDGDCVAGLVLDAYLLARPFAEAVRERRRAGPGKLVRVLSLGCGPARTLADVLEYPGISEVLSLTCVDDDQEAIVHANNLLKSRAPRADITFHQTAPGGFSRPEIVYRGYDIVASLYIVDTLAVADLAALVRSAYDWLNPGGLILLTAFREDGADRWVTDLFLNWRPERHSEASLRSALETAVPGAEVSLRPSASRRNLIISVARPA